MTRAVAFLKNAGAKFECVEYDYRGPGDVAIRAALALGAPTAEVYKTIVFDVNSKPALVLMDSGHRVSNRKLGRAAGVSGNVDECTAKDAERHTGYRVGGISPFGTRSQLPVYADLAITETARVFVNGGSRGLMISIDSSQLIALLTPIVADLRVDKLDDSQTR